MIDRVEDALTDFLKMASAGGFLPTIAGSYLLRAALADDVPYGQSDAPAATTK